MMAQMAKKRMQYLDEIILLSCFRIALEQWGDC
jgi:hypothetical protein